MKKYLITSIGRTGTKSLKNYLDEIPGVTCFHHKIGRRDVPFLFLSQRPEFSNINKAYLEKRDATTTKTDGDFYIEVNPYLRFADAEMLKDLGWEKIYLVRNPKTYLQSVYVRELFSDDDYVLNQMPDNNDPISEDWGTMTRFEKLCWYYHKVHKYILDSGASFYRFEELANDPKMLEKLVSDLGIDTSKATTFELPRLNTSFKYKFRQTVKAALKGKTKNVESLDWDALSEKEKQTYEKLCVSLAKPLGYVL